MNLGMSGTYNSSDVWLTLLSLLCGVVASGIALFLLSRPGSGRSFVPGGGACMGIAIAGMHYTGMAAMRLHARIEYDLGLVSLSVAIAISASFAALWLAFRLQEDFSKAAIWRKLSSALIMGVAISGMHYTGMWATHFTPQTHLAIEHSQTFNQSLLAVAVGMATLFILSLTQITSLYDRQLMAQLMREQALQESEMSVVSGQWSVVDGKEQLTTDNGQLTIQFEVEDTRPGIAAEEIWKLIEQISPENAALAEVLAKKVKDFRLDQIIDLTSND